ncbi:hypothetical protein ACFL08_03215 [Patescibacteria group bacterium]
MKSYIKNKNKKGFSIGEVILSVFIVGTTLVVVTSIMAKSIGVFLEDKNSVIAANLSQEGVELVRNVRDNNWATGQFDDGMDDGSFIIDKDSNLSDASGDNQFLSYSDSEGYIHGAGDRTKFSRQIRVDVSATDETIEVVSLVMWGSSTSFPAGLDACNVSSKCVFTKAVLTDWKK